MTDKTLTFSLKDDPDTQTKETLQAVYDALKEKGYNTNRLRKEKLLGESTIQQLRKGELVSWNNIDRICTMLECQPGDLVEHIPTAD